MTPKTKTAVEQFLDQHLWDDTSAAEIFCIIMEGEDLILQQMAQGNGIVKSDDDRALNAAILVADDAETLVQLMRRSMVMENKLLLMSKLILHETEALPLVRKRILTVGADAFIDCATEFLVRCVQDSCSWILENYKSVRSPYMQSMLWLVAGYRGGEELIPILMNETLRFEAQYPNETYCQGPCQALCRLYWRITADEQSQ